MATAARTASARRPTAGDEQSAACRRRAVLDEPARQIGILTTDDSLVVTSWDAALASMTGIAAARRDRPAAGRGRTRPRDRAACSRIVRSTLDTGAPTVLAPALHRYFIPAPPPRPSSRFDRMQQRVAIGALTGDGQARSGSSITIEDVTERLELEHELADELRNASPERPDARDRAAGGDESGRGARAAAGGDGRRGLAGAALGGDGARRARRDPALVDALVSALREGHRNFSVLSSALQLLSMTGVDLTASLIDLLQHPDADLRIQAALALGTQTGPEAVDALLSALDDEDANVRFHAIEALGKLAPAGGGRAAGGDRRVARFLPRVPGARRAVAHQRRGGGAAPRAAAADELVGDQAAEALGQIGDEDAVAPLVAALDRPHASPASIVDALTAIHRRYAEMFSGGGAHIEELVRASHLRSRRAARDRRRRTGDGRVAASLRAGARLAARRRRRARADAHARHARRAERAARGDCPLRRADGRRLVEQLRTRRPRDTARGGDGARPHRRRARGASRWCALLDEDDRELLVPATAALARLGDGRAFESLLRLLGDADVSVRQGAIGALNSIGHPDDGRAYAHAARATPIRASASRR